MTFWKDQYILADSMNTYLRRISAKEARDNFTDLLGMVYYGKEPVVVEKQGRPFAVVIDPDTFKQYEDFKAAAKKRFFEIVAEIQAANKGTDYAKVLRDVTKEVEIVRRQRYEKEKRAKSNR